MKLICSVILLASLLVSPSYAGGMNAAPQGVDDVLAGGQPPLTREMVDQLIDFFGWAFEAQFTEAEREQFARQRIEEWKRGERDAVESAQKLLAIRARILAAPEGERAGLRAGIQETILKELRKQSDETSRLLLGVYNRAHSTAANLDTPSGGPVKAGRQDDPWAPQVTPRAGKADASELLGEWSQSEVSATDFVNPSTGAHADPSGERLNFRLFPDGTYKIGWMLQSSLYGCTSQVFAYRTGTYTLTSKDNCHAEWNYEKHPPLGKMAYRWQMGETKYGPGLILLGSDGKRRAFVRETGKGLLGS
ncbi:MAG TPA: hypothetical protein VE713_11530 [Pyrinomonadaceae bacterium]|nr:hypothetical protein [Pyrinomonadaceae bacterium]